MSFGFPTRRISAPVDSQTYSAPLSPHLMAAGSSWLNPQEVRIHDIHRFTPLKNNITREKNQPFEDVNQQVMEFGVGHGSYKWGNWGHSPTYRSYKPRFVTGRGPPLARFLPVFFVGRSQDPGRPKKNSFSFSWKTAMSLPFTTSSKTGYRRLLLDQLNDYGFSKENYELRIPKQRNNIHFRDLYFEHKSISSMGKVPFFFDKKGAEFYYCPADFWWIEKNPIGKHWIQPWWCPRFVSRSVELSLSPLTHKRHVFFSWFFRGYSFSKQKNHHYKINSKRKRKHIQKIPSVLNSGWPNKCSLPQDHSLKVSPQNRMGVSKLPCWLWYW